jgi:transketolase
MPSTSVFDRQDRAWRDAVLPRGLPSVAVEAGVSKLWAAYGCTAALGIDRFGESAPGPELMKAYGFTAEHLAELVADEVGSEPQIERSSN